MRNAGPMLQLIATSELGGAEQHTRLIAKAFCRMGVEVVCMFPPGPFAPQFRGLERFGVRCIEHPMKANLFGTIRKVREIIDSHRIQSLHSHMHWADFIGACACIGRPGVRQFSTVHFLATDYVNQLVRLRASAMQLFAFHRMRRVFAVSTDVARRTRLYFGLRDDRVVMTINSIDFEEMVAREEGVRKIREELKPGGRTRVVLCAGLLHRIKGQRYLVEACPGVTAAHPDVKCVFLGEGRLKDDLMKMAQMLGVWEKVVFAGFRPDIADWMSAADIYVQPSLVDSMPRALLEAMYLGLPVVASRLDTIREVVKDRQTGLLADPASPKGLASAINALLDDPAAAETYGRNAREFVLANCSIDAMAGRILDEVWK